MKIDLRHGDCIEVLKTLPDNSVDSVVTDPPYHLTSIVKRFGKEDSAPAQFGSDGAYARASKGFMGKEWDGGDIAFRTDVWSECFRVLKPGGHLLAFSHSRTYHRMAVAVEDAGFEIRDQIMWVYGSGFPKSLNIGKKHKEWEGWGTALKPSHEPIVLARKPLSEKSIAENVLKHGTGGINIDGSRIVIGEGDKTSAGHRTCNIFETEKISGGNGSPDYETHEAGRFPANIIFDEEAGQLLDEQSYKASRFFYCPKTSKKDRNEGLDNFTPKTDRQKGHGLDRICGHCGTSMLKPEDCKCEEPDWITPPKLNHHPTVKPTDLMRYLINLITPPNGVILDPFMGSGSTGKAAVRCGVNFIGIEKEQEYLDIARARIEYENTNNKSI